MGTIGTQVCREDRVYRSAGGTHHSSNIIGNKLFIPLKIKITCGKGKVTTAARSIARNIEEIPETAV